MTTIVALPVVATWTVVLGVLGLIGWMTVSQFRRASARLDADIKRELADEQWIHGLRGREGHVIPFQRSPHPIHDQLAVEQFRAELDEYGEDA